MNRILILSVLTISSLYASGQESRKGCEPTSCKPGQTKFQEAEIIGNLRLEVERAKQHVFGSVPSWNIEKGKTDQQSLQILITELNKLELHLERPVSDFEGLSDAKKVQAMFKVLKGLNGDYSNE